MKKLFLFCFFVFNLNAINFENKNSFIVLKDQNSSFKVNNLENFNGWRQTGIIKSLPESSLFLTSNQEWGTTSGDWIPPQESFDLLNDLKIADDNVVLIRNDAVIDGNGNSLILGRYSQILLDGNVSVTFKNIKIQNSFNSVSKPPIRCTSWYSQLCLDNVELALADDFAFRAGQLFIHDDVVITGSSKFSYRSPSPSYITKNSTLVFSPKTTFEFYPSTTDNALIHMEDKSSKIFFNGSTLQTTHTGIRLTKGSIYFDNKVTLSSVDNTYTDSLYNLGTTSESDVTYSVVWSPDGRYLAVGNSSPSYGNRLYRLDGEVLTSVYETTEKETTYSVAWSPDGRYLAVGNSSPSYGNRLYRLDGEVLTPVYETTEKEYTHSVAWSPDGRYLAVVSVSGDYGNRLYRLDGEVLKSVYETTEKELTYSVAWSPDGRYLAVGNYFFSYGNRLYRLDGEVLTSVYETTEKETTTSVAWCPDGRYLAVGNYSGSYGNRLYRLDGEVLTSVYETTEKELTCSVAWSPDGRYLAVGNYSGSYGNRLYRLDGEVLTSVYETTEKENTYSVAWSPDGRYLAVGNVSTSYGNRLYRLDGEVLTSVYETTEKENTYSVAWIPDGKYLAVGNYSSSSGNRLYEVRYRFDTTPQAYSNSVVFGDSSLGSDYELDIYVLAAARLEVFGKMFYDEL